MRAWLPLFAFLFCVHHAEARWATKDDMDYLVENEDLEYVVAADGTYSVSIDRTYEILKESAKATIGTQSIQYSGSSSAVKVLEAETINGTSRVRVPDTMIEDKDIGSSQEGFDDQRQTLIAFPDVKVGSRLHVKFTMKVNKVPLPGFFSEQFLFGVETYVKACTIRVESAIPLYMKYRDPNQQLFVSNSEEDGKYLLSVRLREPVIVRPVLETSGLLPRAEVPEVDLSTARSWADLAPLVRAPFEAVMKAPLPQTFVKILATAKNKKSVNEKIQVVMAGLAETLNYVGDWRSVGGKYSPREFSQVDATKHADCKDMASLTTAILRQLGIHADVALVFRGEPFDITPSWAFRLITQSDVPDIGLFNHAIVRVQEGNKALWIDPTNSTAFAEGMRPDVADRPALVLGENTKDLDHTSPARPEGEVTVLEKTIGFGENYSVENSGTIEFKGRAASDATALSVQLNYNESRVQQEVLRMVAQESLVRRWKLDVSPLQTRIVNDVKIPFYYSADAGSFRTSAGAAYNLPAVDQVRNLMVIPERVTDLYVGTPSILERTYHFRDIELLGSESVECRIRSRWVDASRKSEPSGNGVDVREKIVFKEPLISHEELVTPEFRKVQTDLSLCFGSAAIVYRRIPDLRMPASISKH